MSPEQVSLPIPSSYTTIQHKLLVVAAQLAVLVQSEAIVFVREFEGAELPLW